MSKLCLKTALFVLSLGIVLCSLPSILPGGNDTIAPDEHPASKTAEPEDALASSGILTVTTYSGDYEGHLITFPDGTTVSVDCASGHIATLSHFHEDHCDGNQMWNPDNVSVGQVLYMDAASGATVTVVAAGGKVIGGGGGYTTCYNPNRCSMALWVRYGGFDYLTAGDMTGDVEDSLARGLVASGVTVDVVKVSHHGTCTNNTSSFSYFQMIKPEYATITGTATSPCAVCAGSSIINLMDAGARRIYCAVGYNLSCLGTVPPEVRNGTGTLTISTDGTTYSIAGTGFTDGPYVVDDVPTPTPTWDMRTPTYTPTPTPQPHPWAMFHHDVRHTGRSQYAGPSEPVLGWSYKICSDWFGDPVPASAVGGDGRVYAGCYENLSTFNPDGTFAWSYLTGVGGRTSPPAIGSDGRVYAGGYDGYFRAIDSNGALVWQTKVAGSNMWSGSALRNDGVVYVGGSSYNRLYALNSDGAVRWSYRTGDLVNSSPALGSDDSIYVGSRDNRLYAFNSNGSLTWSFVTGDRVPSSPALGNDGVVYVGSADDRLYTYNSNGTLRWSFATGDDVASSPALGSDGRVYVGSADYRFYAVNLDGTLAWSYLTGWYIGSSPALGSDERVCVGSEDNMLYAFDLSGVLSWSYLTGGCVGSSPSLGSDGGVYFGSDDLKFYCLKQAQTETPPIVPTSTITPTPTDIPAETPTETPPPTATAPVSPLVVLPGKLTAGQLFTVALALNEDITKPFDFYMFTDTPAGVYTIYLSGAVKKGIIPLYRNVPKFNAPYAKTVSPAVRIPASMAGKSITFYAVVVEAGKMPPVKKPSDLTPATPYIILMDKASATVEP